MGLNPATEILPEDIPIDEYVDLLLDLEAFTVFYKNLRNRRGKSTTSPTRIGLNGMAGWLAQRGWNSVVETNVSPYPTRRGEELERVSTPMQSRHIFYQLMRVLAPRLVILHGKDALSEFTSKLRPSLIPRTASFTTLVNESPYLGHVTWECGEQCDVFVCPHLRFFGHKGGQRFAPLEQALDTARPAAQQRLAADAPKAAGR